MRAFWEALHTSLVRSVRTQQFTLAFQQAKQQHSALATFDEPRKLVEYLTSKLGDLDKKDSILRVLVTLVQRREHHELASTLVWLGLWPGLDVLYRRRIRRFRDEPDELVAEIASAFTERVERIDLKVVQRVAATLVRSTERDVMDRRSRDWCEREQIGWSEQIDNEDILANRFDVVVLRRSLEADHDLALGLTPGQAFEQELRSCARGSSRWWARTPSCCSQCWCWARRAARLASAWDSLRTAVANASNVPWSVCAST
jgi:hypothetical protein